MGGVDYKGLWEGELPIAMSVAVLRLTLSFARVGRLSSATYPYLSRESVGE